MATRATEEQLSRAYARSRLAEAGVAYEQALESAALRAVLELGVVMERWATRTIERCDGNISNPRQQAAAMIVSGIVGVSTSPKYSRLTARRPSNVIDFKMRAAGEREPA